MIRITIIIDGVAHGQRKWPAVPRVGEFIAVGSDDPHKPYRCEVMEIIWLQGNDDCAVDLICEIKNV